MVKEVLEKYGEKLSVWLRENPSYIFFIGLFASVNSYGLIGNFILHTESWLDDPLKLAAGIVTVPLGFYLTLQYNRLFHRITDSDEEFSLGQEIVAAVLILPVFMIWAPVHILKDTLGGGSE